jgi:hypothetical protein
LRSDSSLNLIINENNSGVGQNYYYWSW